jgi:hypothetical protein
MATTAFAIRDFHPIDNAHAGHTRNDATGVARAADLSRKSPSGAENQIQKKYIFRQFSVLQLQNTENSAFWLTMDPETYPFWIFKPANI